MKINRNNNSKSGSGEKVNKPSVGYWPKYALLSSILLVTFWCYHYSLANEFTNWDDNRFVTDNIFIRSFSPGNLKMILFHDITGDYYNPVTMISYALNYHYSGLSPRSYYLINILIHLLNSGLVFFLTLKLFRVMEKKGYGIFNGKERLAFFCTLAFAVHPMHVESVSWIAERKDVLYGFFYFAGIMTYIRYTESKRNKYLWLILTFICYLVSLLSKPMAVVFPLSLLMIDVLLKRDKTLPLKKIVFEKVPFVLIMLIALIATYYSEKVSGAAIQHNASLIQRILFASYSFFIYILKAIIPMPQSSYYPYPETGASGYLPFVFYVSPIIALLIVSIPVYFSYRSGENNFRVVLFGLGFYFFNMVMLSKIIDSGPYFLADRYTYVCYFGLFYAATFFISKLLRTQPLKGAFHKEIHPENNIIQSLFRRLEIKKKITITAASLFIVFLSIVCYERTYVWHNSETLWTDVVEKYPHRVLEAYNSLGNYYFEQKDIEKAYENYQEAISLKMEDPKVFCNMGILMRAKKQYKSALDYYTEALRLDSNDAIIYVNRANMFAIMRKYDLAIKDYRHSLRLNPYSEVLLANIAFTYLNAKQFDSAINYYTRVIQINPSNPAYFHYRGAARFENGEVKSAMDDFMQNLQIAPHDSECMYYLSVAFNHIDDSKDAYKYAQLAQNAGYRVPSEYFQTVKDRLNLK